jgi:hypothetical protein
VGPRDKENVRKVGSLYHIFTALHKVETSRQFDLHVNAFTPLGIGVHHESQRNIESVFCRLCRWTVGFGKMFCRLCRWTVGFGKMFCRLCRWTVGFGKMFCKFL